MNDNTPRQASHLDQARGATAIAGAISGDLDMIAAALREAEESGPTGVFDLVVLLAAELGVAAVEAHGDEALDLTRQAIVDQRELAALEGES